MLVPLVLLQALQNEGQPLETLLHYGLRYLEESQADFIIQQGGWVSALYLTGDVLSVVRSGWYNQFDTISNFFLSMHIFMSPFLVKLCFMWVHRRNAQHSQGQLNCSATWCQVVGVKLKQWFLHFYIYIYAFSRRFYPKRLTGYTFFCFCQYMCSLGIKPTTFALLTQCSNHWATGTHVFDSNVPIVQHKSVDKTYFSPVLWILQLQ